MTAGTWNFTIEQGATFDRQLTWRDSDGNLVPLTGKTARMHLRAKVTDAVSILELTTENGRITLVNPGEINLLVSAEDTADLNFTAAVHDLEVVDPGFTPEYVVRLVAGSVALSKEVTR